MTSCALQLPVHAVTPSSLVFRKLYTSGMNMPIDNEKWQPPTLTEDELVQMRAPPDMDLMEQDSSGDDNEDISDTRGTGPAGAFPGTHGEYKASYY